MCHSHDDATLVLLPPGYWGLFLNLIFFFIMEKWTVSEEFLVKVCTLWNLRFFRVLTLTQNSSETGYFSIMKKLRDLKKVLSNHGYFWVGYLKSVHFKKTVARISILSKLWYFLFWFVLKIPQFWKKIEIRATVFLNWTDLIKFKFSGILIKNHHGPQCLN